MGERQVAIQEVQDQEEGADDEGKNGEKYNFIFKADDGTAKHKERKKEKVIPQKQQASESVAVRSVNEVRGLDKIQEKEEDSNKNPKKYIEKGGPSMRRIGSTNRGAWTFTNQRPNRNRQQIKSGPTEEERNFTIGQLLKEFNKNMAEEKRKRNKEREDEKGVQNRNNMDIDGQIKQFKPKEQGSEQRNKQIVTESDEVFYYVELAEEEEEMEQKNGNAIVVAREYETELVQRMEEKLKLKRRREEDQQEQIENFLEKEEKAMQMWVTNKKNKWSRGLIEGRAHEEELRIKEDWEDSMAEEAGLYKPPTQP
ncbi:uncharacterized protein LOC130966541 [Arachis stenosperma]|uniref:uncharacterized protein LOC130966541 n=1 Tax=Arachis stenosperma TaxID=217475 RepID=UPI0025AC8DA6|nr:uncharacterized protein LOC130966541 [Arachis stenosperma]